MKIDSGIEFRNNIRKIANSPYEVTQPDFTLWAFHIVQDYQSSRDIAIALEQAYSQGFSYGYAEGKDTGWQQEWDAVYSEDPEKNIDD